MDRDQDHGSSLRDTHRATDKAVLVQRLKERRDDDPLFLEAAVALSWTPWNDRETLRRIVSDLTDEVIAAERGKATTRAARKHFAKAAAVNQILAIRQAAPASSPATPEGREP